jgi:hypothetical protein
MDNKDNDYPESYPNDLNLFGEIRTIPACWDVSSIMDRPKISNNGWQKLANHSIESSGFEQDQTFHGESTSTFDDWYLGTYLDMENDPYPSFWCAYW